MKYSLLFSCTLYLFFANLLTAQNTDNGIQIAFLSDVHLQDLYGNLTDTNYKGVRNPKDGKPVLLRTMEAQLHSTRLFNENYFAFLAALNDIAARGIKLVAMPGDYSDDGQPIHVRGLKKILNDYSQKYGIQFFITTGNHDPVGPFSQDAGKNDFLGEGGKPQPIFSNAALYQSRSKDELPLVISSDIAKMGYLGITTSLSDFGFYPKKNYRYWATPFSTYTTENYRFETAEYQSALEKRQYEVVPGNTIPDASYLVEPVNGLWLLALDGNVYLPKKNTTDQYQGADIGYNNVLTHKKHLISWVQKVAADAKRLHKTLIAFSHYPMIDFNDDANSEIETFMGKGKWQLDRVPVNQVAETFADAGLQIHFGGHMHLNDTGIYKTVAGNTLVNIQTPSLAAYIPAYKLVTIKADNLIDVQTITIDNVPHFDALFDLYKMEYHYLKTQNPNEIWNKKILKTKNYHEFTDFHLKELVRLRFLPDDWKKPFADFMLKVSGYELIVLANMDSKVDFDILLKDKKHHASEWKSATLKAKTTLAKNNLKLGDFKNWNGLDLIIDFYRIRSADQLAFADISSQRLQNYQVLSKSFIENQSQTTENPTQTNMDLFLKIMTKFLNGAPAAHFNVDLNLGTVTDLN